VVSLDQDDMVAQRIFEKLSHVTGPQPNLYLGATKVFRVAGLCDLAFTQPKLFHLLPANTKQGYGTIGQSPLNSYAQT